MRKRLKLKHEIFIAITVVAVTVLVVFWAAGNRRFSGLITERVVDDYQETTATMRQTVETVISYTNDFAKYMSMDKTLQEAMRGYRDALPNEKQAKSLALRNQCSKTSIELIYSTSMIAGVGMYIDNEQVYSFYNAATEFETDIIPLSVLEEASERQRTTWTSLMTLKPTGMYKVEEDHVFAVLKSVQGDDGHQLGMIVLFVRESSFAETMLAAESQQNKRFYLTDENGQIISASNQEHLYSDVRDALGLTAEEYDICDKSGKLLVSGNGSAPTLYMSIGVDTMGWKLVGETLLEDLAAQQRDLRFFMMLVLALSVGMAVLAAWYVSKSVTKPLSNLISVMKRLETEEPGSGLRVPTSGNDEMRLLGNEFNALMDQIDYSAEQIYLEQSQRRHNEVKLLQAQIVPHFLYNTMGTISAFIKLDMQDEALRTIQNLVSFYRLSLSGGEEIITLEEEIELTRNYLALQQLRYIEFMDYTIDYDDSAGDIRIPKLTIQPLVENVLQHGLKPNGHKCLINVRVFWSGDSQALILSVCDNGGGISPERLMQLRQSLVTGENVTKSFGVLNVHQRLKLQYGSLYHMEIESTPGEETCFSLYLPQ